MEWYNEPPQWTVEGDTITVHTGPKTDFWRLTYSGVVEDSGHFYYQRQTGDFQAEVQFSGTYAAMYDQAGLMVRVDEANWLKCGIEFIDGVQFASAVVTHDHSDWSVATLSHASATFWLRLKRMGSTIEVYYALDGTSYQLLRQSYLAVTESLDVGIMCASPVGEGFAVKFTGFTIGQLR